jgi:hypothetical protein
MVNFNVVCSQNKAAHNKLLAKKIWWNVNLGVKYSTRRERCVPLRYLQLRQTVIAQDGVHESKHTDSLRGSLYAARTSMRLQKLIVLCLLLLAGCLANTTPSSECFVGLGTLASCLF